MQLHEFAQAYTKAASLKALNQLMQRFLNTLGVQSYAFTYYDLYPSSQRPLRYSYVSPKLEIWHLHFIASQYEDVDQTLQLAKKMAEPVFWDVHEQQTRAKTAKEIRLREESIAYHIHKGVLIPVHGPGDEFAALVVHQRQGETWLDKQPDRVHQIFAASYYYFAQLSRLLSANAASGGKFQLTPRELQCLQLSAKGYLARDIAKALHITERTVHYHMQNLNKKLGVANKYQAIQRALRHGLLRA